MTGAQFKAGLLHVFRDETWAGEHTEFYQLSHGLEVEYDQKSHSFLKFNLDGAPIDESKIYSVGLKHYHYLNTADSFGLDLKELQKNHMDRVVSTSTTDIIEERLLAEQHKTAEVEGRIVVHLT
jgi:5'-nucleotidase